jgi:hypothetical protein
MTPEPKNFVVCLTNPGPLGRQNLLTCPYALNDFIAVFENLRRGGLIYLDVPHEDGVLRYCIPASSIAYLARELDEDDLMKLRGETVSPL